VDDKMQHNMHVCHAMNFLPVSLVLIVVKADMRMENTLESIRNHTECFQDLSDLLGVCVTHMDTVAWQDDDFLPLLEKELGIDSAIFVGLGTAQNEVLEAILEQCKTPQDVSIDSRNFLKFFKVNNNNMKVLRSVRAEVASFQVINKDFQSYMKRCNETDRVDLAFEFQAYMTERIVQAQKRVSELNGFTFMGDAVANEAGHIANLTNQLRSVLFEVRSTAFKFTSSHAVSDLRKCPHCGLIWLKVEGCEGETFCGALPQESELDVRSTDFCILATFSFNWDGSRLDISKTGTRDIERKPLGSKPSKPAGCGKRIVWNKMAPVSVPSEFSVSQNASVDDVDALPEDVQPAWDEYFADVMSSTVMSVYQG